MTDEEKAEKYAKANMHYEIAKRENGANYAKEVNSITIKQAYLAGLDYKNKENAELKEENAELKQYAKALEETDNTNILHCMKVNGKLYKAKEIIKEMLSILSKENIEGIYEITEEAEQFLNSEVEQ